MSAESDLATALQANATLTAVVSTRTEPAPLRHQQTLPAVTWWVVNREFEQAVDRTVRGTRTSYQFDCWDDDGPAAAEAVAAALKTALLAFTTSAHTVILTGEWDVPEPDDTGIFHRAVTVDILT